MTKEKPVSLPSTQDPGVEGMGMGPRTGSDSTVSSTHTQTWKMRMSPIWTNQVPEEYTV